MNFPAFLSLSRDAEKRGVVTVEIVIVGGGKLGEELCRDLNDEGHDITIIEKNGAVLKRLTEDIDIKGICGSGTNLDVQRDANVASSKLFIAVTGSDDVNIIAAVLAEKLGADHIIARIRNHEYTANELFIRNHLGLDYMINQDKEAAADIVHVLDYPSASYVEPFNHGKVPLVKIRILAGSKMVGMSAAAIRAVSQDLIICVLERNFKTVIIRGDTIIQADDQIDLIASRAALNQFARLAGHKNIKRLRSAFIVGGSRINHYLLPALHIRGIQAKIIEIDPDRAEQLAIQFPNFEIIVGDGTDQDFLMEQRLQNYDVAIGLTDSDEENLMFALFAAELQVFKNITKTNRPKLTQLLNSEKLDVMITPRKSVSDAIIRRVRSLDLDNHNNLVSFATLAAENTEVLEFSLVATDRVTQFPIAELQLKAGIVIGVIIRNNHRLLPTGTDQIQADDQVIIINVGEKVYKIDDILVNSKKRGGR